MEALDAAVLSKPAPATEGEESFYETAQVANHLARVCNIRGRYFAWLGGIDCPRYMAHALTPERALELLEESHNQQDANIGVMVDTVAHHVATVLKIEGHPSGDAIFLGVIGGNSSNPMLAHGRSREGCLVRLGAVYEAREAASA